MNEREDPLVHHTDTKMCHLFKIEDAQENLCLLKVLEIVSQTHLKITQISLLFQSIADGETNKEAVTTLWDVHVVPI